jgi:hypothetical protein
MTAVVSELPGGIHKKTSAERIPHHLKNAVTASGAAVAEQQPARRHLAGLCPELTEPNRDTDAEQGEACRKVSSGFFHSGSMVAVLRPAGFRLR